MQDEFVECRDNGFRCAQIRDRFIAEYVHLPDRLEGRPVVQPQRGRDTIVSIVRDISRRCGDPRCGLRVLGTDEWFSEAANGVQRPRVLAHSFARFDAESLVVFVVGEPEIEHMSARQNDRTTNFQRFYVVAVAAEQRGRCFEDTFDIAGCREDDRTAHIVIGEKREQVGIDLGFPKSMSALRPVAKERPVDMRIHTSVGVGRHRRPVGFVLPRISRKFNAPARRRK